jgi:ATP-binding cassette subfamily B protein
MLSVIYRVWLQFDSKRRAQFFYILTLSIVVSLLEVVSISAVLPFIVALTTPEELFAWEEVKLVAEYFEIYTPRDLLLPITLMFISLTVLSSLLRMLLLWSQTRFSFSVGVELSHKMYVKALYRRYLTTINQNSNKTISDIMLKAEMFVDGLILPVMIIIGTLFLLSIMVFFVILLDPYMAIYSVIIFGFLYLLVTVGVKKKIEAYSVNILKGQDEVFITLREGFGSIRDVILDNLQEIYGNKFKSSYGLLRRNKANVAIIGAIPRYVIESVGMVVISILAFNMTVRGVDKSYILPVLGGFALTAQRMLPALHKAFSSWADLKGAYMPIQNALVLLETENNFEYRKIINVKNNGMIFYFEKFIKLDNISFSYEETKTIDRVDIEIKKGERIAVVGETGSGKSTLIDIIMGLIDVDTGSVFVDDKKCIEEDKREWQCLISHVPQAIFLLDKTLIENIAIGVSPDNVDFDRVIKAADDACISGFIKSLPNGYNTVIGEDGSQLSGGQRQRIGIARALYKQSQLIVLDEATSALDRKTEEKVLKSILKNEKLTVLMITHRPEVLKMFDRVIYMKNGRVEKVNSSGEI